MFRIYLLYFQIFLYFSFLVFSYIYKIVTLFFIIFNFLKNIYKSRKVKIPNPFPIKRGDRLYRSLRFKDLAEQPTKRGSPRLGHVNGKIKGALTKVPGDVFLFYNIIITSATFLSLNPTHKDRGPWS